MAKKTNDIAGRIAQSLEENSAELARQFETGAPVPHFILDDVLPEKMAREIAAAFPACNTLVERDSLRENKFVGVELEKYSPLVGEALLAFQDNRVIAAVGKISGIPDLRADPSLYAAGLSAMKTGNFLNPHLDNSHDGDGRLYRALNILYYASPDWPADQGGNLELWDPRVRQPVPVHSRFNRLVVMQTNAHSWHSVSRVTGQGQRNCLSNYYFSAHPPSGKPYRHVTVFAGRPEQPARRLVLKLDGWLRNLAGRLIPTARRKTFHRRPSGDK